MSDFVEQTLAQAERDAEEARRLRPLFNRGYLHASRSPDAWLNSEAHRYRQEVEWSITEPFFPPMLIGARFKLKDEDYARECTDLGYQEIIILGERGRFTTMDYGSKEGPRVGRVGRDVMLLGYMADEDHWSLVPQDPSHFFEELYEYYEIVSMPGLPHDLPFKPSTKKNDWYTKQKAEKAEKASQDAAAQAQAQAQAPEVADGDEGSEGDAGKVETDAVC